MWDIIFQLLKGFILEAAKQEIPFFVASLKSAATCGVIFVELQFKSAGYSVEAKTDLVESAKDSLREIVAQAEREGVAIGGEIPSLLLTIGSAEFKNAIGLPV